MNETIPRAEMLALAIDRVKQRCGAMALRVTDKEEELHYWQARARQAEPEFRAGPVHEAASIAKQLEKAKRDQVIWNFLYDLLYTTFDSVQHAPPRKDT